MRRPGGSPAALRKKARGVKLLILDVDGVLTDGGIILDGGRNEYKKFNVRDGHGIKVLIQAGVEVAILSGRRSRVVARRARELGIKYVHQGSHNKIEAYEKILASTGFGDGETAYVGDDIVDIPVLKRVALPVAVADSQPDTKKYAFYITAAPGGHGAAREVAEIILKAKGFWDELIGASP